MDPRYTIACEDSNRNLKALPKNSLKKTEYQYSDDIGRFVPRSEAPIIVFARRYNEAISRLYKLFRLKFKQFLNQISSKNL